MEKLKVGIIGCGGIANGKHMPSIKKVQNLEMVAFCDIIRERAEKAAREYGTPDAKVYTDYKEMLKDESINNVRVLTPNRLHAQISIDAMRAGKHVLCEKPMANTLEECEAMVRAAEESGRFSCFCIVFRTRLCVLKVLQTCEKLSKIGIKYVYF